MDGTGEPNLTSEIKDWDAADYLKKRIPQANYARRSFDRGFYRNALFYLGQQWIRFSRTTQSWRAIPVPDWFPRNVTNKYGVAIDHMKSVFLQSDPPTLYAPAGDDPSDIAASRAAADVSRFIEQECDQKLLESLAASWLTITGNAFIFNGYDKDAQFGTNFVPDYICLQCQKVFQAKEYNGGCPNCGSQLATEAKSEDGTPMGQQVPIGKLFSEVASPFEVHFDLQSGHIDHSPYVYRAKTYPLDVLRKMFPEFKDSIRSDDAGIDSGMFYQSALSYITNTSTIASGNYGGAVGSVDNVPRATLYHIYVRPDTDFPDGREALVISNTTVWKSALSYHDQKGNPFVPATHIQFYNVPGRVFGKTPADDLVAKQIQRNMVEALIQLCIQRTSNPTWLLPKGIGLDRVSGEPGEKMRYNAMLGFKPERLGGAEIPGAVFRWMQTLDFDMQDLSHTPDILKGMTPKGFPTLGGAQLLLERGYAGYSEPLKFWCRAWTRIREQRLDIWREYCSDERTMMVLGKNNQWEAKKLSSDTIKGRINVYLEEGKIAPKSKAYQQLITGQLIQSGLVDMNDPLTKDRIMQQFDATDLSESLDVDIKDAEKEKEDFIQSGQPRPRQGIDNDAVHLAHHLKVCKSDEFWTWSQPLRDGWIQHTLYHEQQLAQQKKQAQQDDPRVQAAQLKLQEIQVELQALMQEKGMEIQTLQAKKNIDLHAHGAKKGLDTVLNISKMKAGLRNGKNGNGNGGGNVGV